MVLGGPSLGSSGPPLAEFWLWGSLLKHVETGRIKRCVRETDRGLAHAAGGAIAWDPLGGRHRCGFRARLTADWGSRKRTAEDRGKRPPLVPRNFRVRERFRASRSVSEAQELLRRCPRYSGRCPRCSGRGNTSPAPECPLCARAGEGGRPR